ncbi:MAG: hypothetical protein PHI31_06685 [Desulfuromonadaceae bacterium]|nr:hypothetical protein [Desulfuromonadaceae bacterium]
MKRVTGSIVIVLAVASLAGAATSVNVDVNTPNASVRIGTPQPPPHVTVIEQERVIVREHHYDERKDNGKHKGQKKHKKHKKDHHDEREGRDRHHSGR